MVRVIYRCLTTLLLLQIKLFAQSPNVYKPGGSAFAYVNGHIITNIGGLNIINYDTNVVIQSQRNWRGLPGTGSYMYMEKVFSVNENGQDYLLWCGHTDVFGYPPDWSGITYVVKTDLLGDTVWTHLYDGGMGTGFCLAPDSNYIFTPIDGYGTIVKADKNTGDTLWTKRNTWNLGSNDKLMINTGFATANDSSIFYSGVTYPVAPAAFLLMKTDTLGVAQWVKAYGDTTTNISWGAAQCHDGGFIMVGQSAPDDGNLDTLWYHDFLVVRTDINGDTLWCKRYDHNLQVDKAYCVVETNDHGFVILGTTLKKLTSTSIVMSTLLVKIDSIGNPVWAKTFSPGFFNSLYFVSSLRKTDQFGFMWVQNDFVNVTDSMGVNCIAQSTTVTVGQPQIQVYSLITTLDNDMDYCYRPNTQQGNPINYPIIDYCDYLGVENQVADMQAINIYPNPVSSTLTIRTKNKKEHSLQIEIYDAYGQKIISKKMSGSTYNLDVEKFKNGLYFIQANSANGEKFVQKFVVQH